jgi:hypothetical protein
MGKSCRVGTNSTGRRNFYQKGVPAPKTVHQTEPSKDITFANVVLKDSIQIAFLVAALNDLEILSTDISGAILMPLVVRKSTLKPVRNSDLTRRVDRFSSSALSTAFACLARLGGIIWLQLSGITDTRLVRWSGSGCVDATEDEARWL